MRRDILLIKKKTVCVLEKSRSWYIWIRGQSFNLHMNFIPALRLCANFLFLSSETEGEGLFVFSFIFNKEKTVCFSAVCRSIPYGGIQGWK